MLFPPHSRRTKDFTSRAADLRRHRHGHQPGDGVREDRAGVLAERQDAEAAEAARSR